MATSIKEPGDMTDIERLRLVVSPASRSVDIYAQSHRGSLAGAKVYERAICAVSDASAGARSEPLMTLTDDAAWDLFKEMCRVFAADFSTLEFNEVSHDMAVKAPGAGGGRFIPAGERTPLEAQLLEKVDTLERIIAAKDDNLKDLRSMLPMTVECDGADLAIRVEDFIRARGPGEPLTPPKDERY